MRYYIADCHFFHGALNHKMDRRGFETEEAMNEYMIEKWNAKVKKKDEVVILGDFSLGGVEETKAVLDRLQGKLHLILGNHDRVMENKKMDLSRFVWVKRYAELSDNNRKVILCHYPVMCYNGQYRLENSGKPHTYMLYGHVHDTMDQRLIEQFQDITRRTVTVNAAGETQQIPCNMINCFCKYSDYEPLSLDEWIALDEKRRAAQMLGNGNAT
ncbi:MAG: metallophosphoesterase family protein [Lachnospiraceae bacterium]|nr:metallophosphoesterase family protein [Lachnospiraceae bacterium]MBQ2099702.1 metallophosphoesterase family protein [Lachnospiraceae bacterium]MBQ3907401.1 metallophosphoesterase family protein [Lachnospiraceae bacterium]